MLTAIKALSVLAPGTAITTASLEKHTETAKLAEANNKATMNISQDHSGQLKESEPEPIMIEQVAAPDAELIDISVDEDYYISPPICDPYYQDCPGRRHPNKEQYSKNSVHAVTWTSLSLLAIPTILYSEIL